MGLFDGSIQLAKRLFHNQKGDDIFLIGFWNSLYIAFFLLPFGINLPTFLFVISIALGVLSIFKSKTILIKDNRPLLLLPLYFVIMAITLLYSDNISYGLILLKRSLPLLLFPIIFFFIREDSTIIKKLFNFLVFGLIITFFINLVWATYSSISIKNGVLDFDTSIQGGYSFWKSFSHGGNYYIGGKFSRLVHPSYVSLYILVVLVYYLKNKLALKKQIILFNVLFLYLFLLSSKIAFIILLITSVLLIYKENDKNRKYIMIVGFITGLIVFVSNPRMMHFYSRLEEFDYKTNDKNAASEQSRLLTWNASIKLIENAPLFGYGVGDSNDVLIHKYKELNYLTNYQNEYNAHNQYFQTYLQSGIIGFLVLITVFIFLGFRKRNHYEFSIFLILFISLLFESMLVRFNGIVFYSIIIPLLLKRRNILNSRIIRNTEK